MNNRRRLIARVYRQNPKLSAKRALSKLCNQIKSNVLEGIMALSEAMKNIMISANEAAKAFDWSDIAERMRDSQ